MRNLARFTIAFALLFASGCALSYEYDLAHAYVTPWTRLPQSDIQEIIRVVSRRSTQTIIGVNQDPSQRKADRVDVYTGNETSEYYWCYTLQRSGATWRIVDGGRMSISVIGIALSNPPTGA
jgi:hypothetical protein